MKNTIITIIVIVVVVLIGLVIYYAYKSKYSSSNSNSNSAPQAANEVLIQNFAFNPANLSVKVGDTVTWRNDDSAAHSIEGITNTSMKSNDLNIGDTYQFTFDKNGTFEYICGTHTYMKGSVTVQ